MHWHRIHYEYAIPLSSLLLSCVWILVLCKMFGFTAGAVGKVNNEVVQVHVHFNLFPDAVDRFPAPSKPSKQGAQTSGACVPPLTHTGAHQEGCQRTNRKKMAKQKATSARVRISPSEPLHSRPL